MVEDTELIKKFHEILEQHKGIFFKVAKTYCRNENDRQDLLQEIMIQVWKSLHRYNDNYAISTWIYRIALNVAISFYRKQVSNKKSTIQLFDEDTSIQEEINLEKQEQLNLLEQCISELNDLDKALIILYLEDKSYAEISEIMGLTVSNVGTKLSRIKEKIKSKFHQKK